MKNGIIYLILFLLYSQLSFSKSGKYDCGIVNFILNDSVVKNKILPVKHKELPLIVNDRHYYFSECTTPDILDRKIVFTHDTLIYGQMIKSKALKSTIYILKMLVNNNDYFIEVFDPSSGTDLTMKFYRKNKCYIAYDYKIVYV